MVVTRFAPSPTGLLHLGHAYSALLAWDLARLRGGRFVLRIEDIDSTRCRPAYTDALLDDLAWLGLSWDVPVRRQSEHLARYQAALKVLAARGLVYPCFCSRKDIETSGVLGAPHGFGGLTYPGTCRSLSPQQRQARLAQGEPYAWRLKAHKAMDTIGRPLFWHDLDRGEQRVDPDHFGDVVLGRKETPTSYHLSVTLDDALQGVTLVTRGLDLFEATPVHRLLQALFDLPTPSWFHHPLLVGPDGKRYAKRDRSLTLQALRASGETPESVRERVGLTAFQGNLAVLLTKSP